LRNFLSVHLIETVADPDLPFSRNEKVLIVALNCATLLRQLSLNA
jgi:hypothetical protein